MTKFFAGRLLSVAALAASPALAAPPPLAVDAFTEFNGVNGHGGFYYGSYEGVTFTDFNISATGSDCFLPNPSAAVCPKGSLYGSIPGVSKGGSYPTVVDGFGPRLAMHPLDDGTKRADVFDAFQVATTGRYHIEIHWEPIGLDTTTALAAASSKIRSSEHATSRPTFIPAAVSKRLASWTPESVSAC